MSREKQNLILNFWFGDNSLKPLANKNLWFSSDSEIDDDIRMRFKDLLTEAAKGGFDAWANTPNGALALVILLDRFPRHIYRNHPQSYAFDPKALAIAQMALNSKLEKNLSTVERCFLYLPFEQSEKLEDQRRSVELFSSLFNEAEIEEREFIAHILKTAVRHHDMIESFGRFPDRNEILGRPSTPPEKEFLDRIKSSP
jgi:uncharacterized protein (DUF924 family)